MRVPLKYNWRSLFVRRGTALLTIASVAFVVVVYEGVLSLAGGLRRAFGASGEPENVVVLREGAQSETTSYFDLERGRQAMNLPGVVRDGSGRPLGSGEVLILQNLERADGTMTNVTVRGVEPGAFDLRPDLRMVAGRGFERGRGEVIVGSRLVGRFPDLAPGGTVTLGELPFTVVGTFDDGGSAFDSEVWTAVDDVRGAYRRQGYYSSVLLRAASPSAARELADRVEADQRLKLRALPERAYYALQTASTSRQFIILGNALALIMAFGACFAAANTMYASIAARTREIATLRALGFPRRTLLVAFLIEAGLLGLVAGAVGVVVALPLNLVSTGTTNFTTFSEISFSLRTTPGILAGGILLAVLTGVLGGLPPAWSAARMGIARGLRAP